MCVDKAPQELASFAALAQEAQQFGKPWDMVFAAAMSGTVEKPPTSAEAEKPLQDMVEAIKLGRIEAFIPFDTAGQPVNLF